MDVYSPRFRKACNAFQMALFPTFYKQLFAASFLIFFSLTSTGQVVINEVITDPQQDWSTNGFDGTDGGGSINQGTDEWIELYITGNVDLTGWTIELTDGTPTSGDLTNTGAFDVSNYIGTGSFSSTNSGDYLILGDVDGSSQMSNTITVTLRDDLSNLIDQVVIDNSSGTMFDGDATGSDDESVCRIPNSSDTDVDATDFAQTRATLGTNNSPSGTVLINEVVTDPQQDWEGGSFSGTPGAGTANDGTDEWIELYIGTDGLNLTRWNISVNDGVTFSGDLTSSGAFQAVNYVGSGSFANTQAGDYLVLGNPTGSQAMNNDVFIQLFHPDGTLVDDVEIGDDIEGDGNGDGAPDGSAGGGNATGVDDESVARIANATDTDNDINDFQQTASTMGAENGLTTVFVDASATDDTGLGTVGDPKQLIQSGIDMALSGGTVTVANGTYSESLTIGKSLTVNGANQGTAGNGTRASESIIDPSSNANALVISSDNVTIDGFQFGTDAATSNITNAIVASNTGLTISNNIIYSNTLGISTTGASIGTVLISDNLISMLAVEDALNPTNGSGGIYLGSISGDADVDVTNNDITNSGTGITTYALTSSTEAIIDGGTYTGCTIGVLPLNTDGIGGFSPSALTIQNITMSGFVSDADVTSPDTETGVYVVAAGGTAADDLTITMDNLDISGVGNGASNYSGIVIGDFPSASDGAGIDATITNCNIHDNSNRGIYTRGGDAVTNITQCSITGNGFDPIATGGNPGFSVIARDGSVTTVTNCTITNPASLSAAENIPGNYYTAGLHASTGGSLTVSDCSISQNGNGFLAETSGIDMSGNYLGTTTEATILTLTGGSNDFTPWLASGTDTDGGTAGFQGDFSDLIVGTSGTQTGASGRIEEGISLVDASGTVAVNAGTYVENLTIGKTVTLNGANQGTAGSGTRVAETIIEPASANVGFTIGANDITIDGFQFGTDNATSNNSTAISNTAFTGLTASNNIIYSNSAGIALIAVSSGTTTISDNLIEMLNLEDPLTATNPSIGIYANNISGSAVTNINDNDISTASYGFLGFALTSSSDLVVDGGTITGCTKGIEADNADGTGNYSPSSLTIQNVTMSGFAGPDADVAAPDAQAGIYIGAFSTLGSGSATDADDMDVTISGVDISGVSNTANDYSAIYIADFNSGEPSTGTSDLIAITASISGSSIHDNLNRGVYTRGANAVTTVTTSTFTDNGSNPTTTGSSLAVFASGTINATNSTFSNPVSGTVSTIFAQQNGVITAQDNSLDQNTNGNLAETQSGGTIDLSQNWLGTTAQSTIAGLVTASGVDFTPWLADGTDTDGGTAGFQPDLSGLFVGSGGSQTSGILQEGHDLIDTDGTISIANDTYSETLTISKDVAVDPEAGTTIDNVTLNGGRMSLLADLTINTTLTLTDGILDLDLDDGDRSDDPVLTLSNAVSGTGSNTNHIEGKVEVAISAAGSYTFPMGDFGTHRPVVLNPTNATTFSVAHVWRESPTGGGANGSMAALIGDNSSEFGGDPIESVLSGMFWEIDVITGAPGSTDVTIQINGSDNASDPSTLGMARFDGSTWSEVSSPVGGGSDPYTITATTTSFSDFSIYSTDATANPLPVELLFFNGQIEEGKVRLSWSTVSEQNADFFQVERSLDDHQFVSLGRIAAAGNSNGRIDYHFLDVLENSNPHYYRLKMVDVDGSFEYSATIILLPNEQEVNVIVYPNPTIESLRINGLNPTHLKQVVFYDLNGKIQEKITTFNDQLLLDVTSLTTGQYIVRIELLDGMVIQQDVMIQR